MSIARTQRREILPNYYSYRLQMNGRELNWEQKAHVINSINKIHQVSKHIIYRGDKKAHLIKAYGIDAADFPKSFSNSLFYYGVKSRLFSLSDANRQRAINISERSENVFVRIFHMIHELMKNTSSNEIRDRVNRLMSKEASLVGFFLTPDNEDVLRRKTEILDATTKIRLRDHYLSLLQHLGHGEYYSMSFLLSTSENFGAANKFAGNRPSHFSDDALITIGWVPEGINNVLVTPRKHAFTTVHQVHEAGLPLYSGLLYPQEKEITLKGGIFPHYILGYLYANQGLLTLEINPALFQVDSQWNGVQLPVDQSTWAERFSSTEFGAYFQLNDLLEFSQHSKTSGQ